MAKKKPLVVLGLLGPVLDAGADARRWQRWRPTVSIFQHEALLVSRLELLHPAKFAALAGTVAEDVLSVSPETEVALTNVEMVDPWDFEEVYGALYAFAKSYPFDPEREEYLVHITTGTHVAQICLFLLTESRVIPGKLLQTGPPKKGSEGGAGTFDVIDLDLSRYDRIAQRFAAEAKQGVSFLKAGIETRNAAFNRLMERIEQVAVASHAPILLMGPTGAGKTQLARRIYELKKARRQVTGPFVEVNCATLRGDSAMSALFGHVRGAFTNAQRDRPGLLRTAHEGVLFLDEIGELGLDEQAMLLRALETRRFLPLGSDAEAESDFQLLAGTNRDLHQRVAEGAFREDLLARIHLWTFRLPSLRERREDLEPNLDYELEQASRRVGARVSMSREARELFLRLATSDEARWSGNFRDLDAAVTRMATLAAGGRVTTELVREEWARLSSSWGGVRADAAGEPELLARVLGPERLRALDRFERVQLEDVLRACRDAASLSDAGRTLFAASRARRSSTNDADRLRKYLARFELTFQDVKARA